MAGAGRKIFTRERATVSDVQNFLMDQAVMVFPSASVRGTAIAAPSAGMVSYLADTKVYSDYVNGAWRGRSDRVAASYPSQTYAATNNYLLTQLAVVPGRPYRARVHAAIVTGTAAGTTGSIRIFDSSSGSTIRDSKPITSTVQSAHLYREFDVLDGSPRTFTINLEVLAGAITTYTDERSSFAEVTWEAL